MNIKQKLSRIAVVGAMLSGIAAWADTYPVKPVRLVVPTSAGQTLDLIARQISEPLSKRLGVPVLIENRPGAGIMLGTEYVFDAPADGYTFLFGSMPHFVTPYVSERAPKYDPLRDFVPVAMLAKTSLGIIVGAESRYRSLGDLVSALRARPGEVTYASGGNATAAHLCATLLNDVAQTTSKHVPYKNTITGITDVSSGIVDFSCQGSVGVLPFLSSNKVRLLAVTGDRRWSAVASAPTTAEAGYKGFELDGWIGVLARTGTPPVVVERMSAELVRIGQQPEFKRFCEVQQMEPNVYGHAQFTTEFPRIQEKFKRLAQSLK